MGYRACGTGWVVVKRQEDVGTVMEKIEGISQDITCEYLPYMKVDGSGPVIELEHEYEKFDSDDMELAFISVKDYISEGSFEMSGEDDEHWRYVFDNGAWYYEPGQITYDSTKRALIKVPGTDGSL